MQRTQSNTQGESWERVTARHPCPVCAKPDWCCTSNGREVVYCMRVESDRPVDAGGWIHRLADAPTSNPTIQTTKRRKSDAEQHAIYEPQAHRYARGNAGLIRTLADCLGVAQWTLRELGVGCGLIHEQWCYTFPEYNPQGQVVGINRRMRDGTKRCIQGSHRGLTYAGNWRDYQAGSVLIVEGPTDTAAALTVGRCVLGRPSNSGGSAMLAKMLAPLPDWRILVIGERDRKADGQWPGKRGAESVRRGLMRRLGRKIEWHMPPGKAKDFREWLQEQDFDVNDKAVAFAAGRELYR